MSENSLRNVTDCWRDIENWIKEEAPDYYEQYYREALADCPGASSEEVSELEYKLGVHLPDDLWEQLRLMNPPCEAIPLWGAGYGYTILGLHDILAFWQQQNNREAEAHWNDAELAQRLDPNFPLRPTWWHHGWLPIALNGEGDYICLDTAPPMHGDYGQIFKWDSQNGPHAPVAASLREFLNQGRVALLAGRYYYDPATGSFEEQTPPGPGMSGA